MGKFVSAGKSAILRIQDSLHDLPETWICVVYRNSISWNVCQLHGREIFADTFIRTGS